MKQQASDASREARNVNRWGTWAAYRYCQKRGVPIRLLTIIGNKKRIEISIPASVPASRWRRLAFKYGRAACEAAGVEFAAAHIFCALPESGHCMVKPAGRERFYSYG